jgi:aminoglycoside phosphotransferase (APT) family kinase protein
VTLAVQRDLEALRAGLSRWRGRPVTSLERPAPGWSCETLVVDRELVVRLPPVGEGAFPTYDLEQQGAAQARAGAAGVPVAAPVRYEPDPEWLGAPFLTMPFVAGPVPAEFTAADPWLEGLADDRARRTVWDAMVDTVAAVHRADPGGLGLRVGLAAELDWWDTYVAWATDGSPPAGLAEALAWCRAHRPPGEPPPSLLWGDVRFGNVVFDDATLRPRAVLDWDMTSAGAAEMDVGWFLALEAMASDLSGLTVPGFGSRADAIARIETAIGRELVDLDWYEVFALVRAAAVWARLAILFERAGQPSMFGAGDQPTLRAAQRRIGTWTGP